MNKAGGHSGAAGYSPSPPSSPVDARGIHRLEQDPEAQLEAQGVFVSARREAPSQPVSLEDRQVSELPHLSQAPQEVTAPDEGGGRAPTPTPPEGPRDGERHAATDGDMAPAPAGAAVLDRNPGHFRQLAQAVSDACTDLHIPCPSCAPLARAPARLCRAMAEHPQATCLAVILTGLLTGAAVSCALASGFHGEKP